MRTIPKPRLFDKRIQIVANGYVPDGFGGSRANPIPGAFKWAYVRKLADVSGADVRNQYGIANDVEVIRVTIRDTIFDTQNQGILYDGNLWNVIVALPNDQYDVSLDLIAIKVPIPDN